MIENNLGEHLISGLTGRYSLMLVIFISAFLFLSSIYFIVSKKNNRILKRTLPGALLFCLFAVGIAVTMMYLNIFNHNFEYTYVWQYTSLDMPFQYLISSLWAGQEGSLLLWLFFIVLIGVISVRVEKTYKTELIAVYSATIFIFSLLMSGIHFGGLHFGISPFELLRQNSDYSASPIFNIGNYTKLITDGNGMNPLLRNPWMIIHPPVLFLGYALTLVSFAYTIAFSVKGFTENFARKVLPWNVLATGILGAGLLLGGVWAYQDLTFGGFWSWDPVENASLVPWLVMVAALHFSIVLLRNKPIASLALFFSYLPFCLVLYAAFLTRSGVLQNASVHSFSGNTSYVFGVLALLFFIVPGILIMIRIKKNHNVNNKKVLTDDTKPENISGKNEQKDSLSKEFLIYIGAIVIALAAFQIIFTTSIPVFNKLFGINLALPASPELFFNNWQMGFTTVICFLSGLVVYFPFKKRNGKKELWGIIITSFISALLSLAMLFFIHKISWTEALFCFSIIFLILATLDYKIRIQAVHKNNSFIISHIGIGVFLLGIIITFTQKQQIESSEHPDMFSMGGITAVKGKIISLNNNMSVSYAERIKAGKKIYYRLDFLNKKDNNYYLAYSLFPSTEIKGEMNNFFFPDIKHKFQEDVLVFLTHAEITDNIYQKADTVHLGKNDSLQTKQGLIIANGINRINTVQDSVYCVHLSFVYHNGKRLDTILSNDYRKSANKEIIIPGTNIKTELAYADDDSCRLYIFQEKTDFIVFNATKFPFIIIIWLGAIIFFIGVIFSVIKRFSICQNDELKNNQENYSN